MSTNFFISPTRASDMRFQNRVRFQNGGGMNETAKLPPPRRRGESPRPVRGV